VERFRAYDSPQASFRDYAGLIGNSPRYAAAVDKGQDVAGFASALQQGGYATDPAYAQKMTKVANEVRGIAAGESFKLAGHQPIHEIARKSS
jgi:flagellum-specific peptidoglycan hydrolase FlgJ